MCQKLQRNLDVIQYLVQDASPEQLTWRESDHSKSLAEVLCRLRDIERWNASIQVSSGDSSWLPSSSCPRPRASGSHLPKFSDAPYNDPVSIDHAFETYAYYRHKTLTLLQHMGQRPYTAIHHLFGPVKLTELVDIIDEYDRIHIHQLQNVIHHMPLNPLYRRALDEISAYHRRYQAHLAQAESLLDIGVGTGLPLQHILRHNLHLICAGVDIRDLRLPQIDVPLQVYDGYTLPFEDNQFDVSLIFYVLHHCVNPLRLLNEAARVTRQKLIIIEEFDRPDADPASLDMTERESHRALGIPPDLPYQLFDQSEFEQMLDERGLVVVQQEVLPSKTTRPVEKYLYVAEVSGNYVSGVKDYLLDT